MHDACTDTQARQWLLLSSVGECVAPFAAAAGAAGRFKRLLMQQTGSWTKDAADLLVNFTSECLDVPT